MDTDSYRYLIRWNDGGPDAWTDRVRRHRGVGAPATGEQVTAYWDGEGWPKGWYEGRVIIIERSVKRP